MAIDPNNPFAATGPSSTVQVPGQLTPFDPVQGLYGRPISDPNWARYFDILKQQGVTKIGSEQGNLLPSSAANSVNMADITTPISGAADRNAQLAKFKAASNALMGLRRAATGAGGTGQLSANDGNDNVDG